MTSTDDAPPDLADTGTGKSARAAAARTLLRRSTRAVPMW